MELTVDVVISGSAAEAGFRQRGGDFPSELVDVVGIESAICVGEGLELRDHDDAPAD
jgi:hypothetical protein